MGHVVGRVAREAGGEIDRGGKLKMPNQGTESQFEATTIDRLLALAGERRPDLIELKLMLEADQQSLIVANNLARPQVDLTGTYQWNGLAGQTPTGVRIQTPGGEFANWTLGVNVSMPLGIRQDRARLRKAFEYWRRTYGENRVP